MKERPILLSAPMVCALLGGRKTQTRQEVKPQPVANGYRYSQSLGILCHCDYLPPDCLVCGDDNAQPFLDSPEIRCPYGLPGDRLWVRETWCRLCDHDTMEARTCYRADDDMHGMEIMDGDGFTMYRKDGRPVSPWKSPMRMPRKYSRITLEITGVRCERLQEISEEDAKAEGLSAISKDGTLIKYGIADRDGLPGNDDHGWHWQEWERDPRNAYHKLWEQINGAGSAVADPWVWVVEFKRVEARP